MKNWEANLIEGVSFLFIGVIVIIFTFQIIEPIDFLESGNLISASLNSTFILLFMAGFFFVGAGIAQAAISSTIYKLEKKLSSVNNKKVE